MERVLAASEKLDFDRVTETWAAMRQGTTKLYITHERPVLARSNTYLVDTK